MQIRHSEKVEMFFMLTKTNQIKSAKDILNL